MSTQQTGAAKSPSERTETSGVRTVVHLLRHGEVENPTGVLYGRLPDFHLSEVGREMAARMSDHLADRDIVHLRSSPLERAQETMAPTAERLGLPVTIDGRVLEAGNRLEGRVVTVGTSVRDPQVWWLLRNPLRPSWGEPHREIVARMRAAIRDAAAAATGHEAVIVSHQLPIWLARRDAEGRRLTHDPRRRQCTLASLTSFTLIDGRVAAVTYAEPVGYLLPEATAQKAEAGA